MKPVNVVSQWQNARRGIIVRMTDVQKVIGARARIIRYLVQPVVIVPVAVVPLSLVQRVVIAPVAVVVDPAAVSVADLAMVAAALRGTLPVRPAVIAPVVAVNP